MPNFSREQQQTLFQIAKHAKTEDVPFEDVAGEFMEQSLTPEEQKQVPEFEGTPEGLVEKEGEYSSELHEKSLRKHRYLNMANDLADTRMDLDKKAMDIKDETNLLQLKTIRMGAQMVQSGAISMGMQALNTVLPEGQRIAQITPLKNNKVRVYSEASPDGEVISMPEYIKALTSAETQYKEMMANKKLKDQQFKEDKLKANEYRLKDGSIVTEPVMRAQYKQTYQLLDDLDLRIMANSNPRMYAIEKAKAEAAPDFRVWADQAYNIDLRGGEGPDIPEGVRPAIYHAEKATGAPEEALRLKKGQSVSVGKVMYRRNKNGLLEKKRIQ